MSETPSRSFIESLPGNPYVAEADRGDYETVDGHGVAHAMLAVAYELRTQTLMTARAMTGSVTDEVIARRLGFTTQK